MIVINNKQYTIPQLRDYRGQDKLLIKIKQKIASIKANFFDKDTEGLDEVIIVFRFRKGIRKLNKGTGTKEGKKMVSIPMVNTTKTEDGSVTVRWCETVIEKGQGVQEFIPKRKKFDGKWFMSINDIDFIVFFTMFCSEYTSGLIVMEDLDGEAVKKAKDRGALSGLGFMLYNEMSPMKEDQIRDMAQGWGILGVFRKSLDRVKNELHDAVEKAEAKHNKEFGLEAFGKAAKKELPKLEVRSAITRAQDLKVLVFDEDKFCWNLINTEDGTMYTLLKLPATELARKEEGLASNLYMNNDRMDNLKLAIKWKLDRIAQAADIKRKQELDYEEQDHSVEETIEAQRDVKSKYDKYTDFSSLHWNKGEMNVMGAAKLAKIPIKGLNKHDIIKKLYNHFKSVT